MGHGGNYVWHCYYHSCCGTGSIPGPGTSTCLKLRSSGDMTVGVQWLMLVSKVIKSQWLMLGDCPCQQRYPLSSLGLILILFKGTILQPIFFLILKYSKKKDLDLLPTDVTLCLWIFFLFQLAEQITTPHSSLCKETPPQLYMQPAHCLGESEGCYEPSLDSPGTHRTECCQL